MGTTPIDLVLEGDSWEEAEDQLQKEASARIRAQIDRQLDEDLEAQNLNYGIPVEEFEDDWN